MYTLIKRTVPPPTMGIFDASNRDLCEVRRLKTNTPLQALVMMNDPAVLEASRVLAGQLLQEKSTQDAKIIKAFRLIVCRKPTDKELSILTVFYQKQNSTLTKETAAKMVAVGEYPLTRSIDQIKQAALMRVISTIYNLEETITKS
jgi:hypothetical protein